jgi:hypothetical protein
MNKTESMNDNRVFLCGLLRHQRCMMPTWRGWIAILLTVTLATSMAVRNAYNFLAVTDPVPGGYLVVEGWGPDLFMQDAISEFRRNHYKEMFVTGGPIEKSAMFCEFKTYAELATATLVRMGFDPGLLHAIPARKVRQDRTYTSALALKKWLREHGMNVTSLTIISMGPHSRRSRLLYQKAFGNKIKVGIIAVEDQETDPQHWWTNSQGFRSVTDEMVAYVYARFLFHPSNEE